MSYVRWRLRELVSGRSDADGFRRFFGVIRGAALFWKAKTGFEAASWLALPWPSVFDTSCAASHTLFACAHNLPLVSLPLDPSSVTAAMTLPALSNTGADTEAIPGDCLVSRGCVTVASHLSNFAGKLFAIDDAVRRHTYERHLFQQPLAAPLGHEGKKNLSRRPAVIGNGRPTSAVQRISSLLST